MMINETFLTYLLVFACGCGFWNEVSSLRSYRRFRDLEDEYEARYRRLQKPPSAPPPPPLKTLEFRSPE